MKALITGVDGFVGKYLFEYLLEQGYEVYGTTILENYENNKINVKKMNLLDIAQVNKVIENINFYTNNSPILIFIQIFDLSYMSFIDI